MNTELNPIRGEGILTVRVTTARGAFPVEGAVVFVYADEDGGRLVSTQTTDKSGQTVPIALAAPPRAMSESPGAAKPYSSYSIQIAKEGFYPVETSGAPVFDGIKSVQEIDLIAQNPFAPYGKYPAEGLKINEEPSYSSIRGEAENE